MPLPLERLDTRTWSELVAEGQALIPKLAPGWTDSFVLSPDDKTIALVRPGEGIRFADVATGEEIRP